MDFAVVTRGRLSARQYADAEDIFHSNIKIENTLVSIDKPLYDVSWRKKIFFSGYAHIHDRLIIGDEVKNADISKLKNATGCFCVLIINNDRISFFTDYFGLFHLYKYESEDIEILCTSRFKLARFAKACGLRLSIDMLEVGHRLSSDLAFSTHSLLDRTFFNEIRLCDPSIIYRGKRNRGKMEFKAKSRKKYYDRAKKYDGWVDQISDDITNNIIGIATHPNVHSFLISVSGGRDTRLILAALDRARVEKPVYSSTLSTTGEADFRIGHALSAAMGLVDSSQQPVDNSIIMSLNEVSHLMEQLYFGEVDLVFAPFQIDPKLARLSGGGGEMLRLSMNKYVGRGGNNQSIQSSITSWMIKRNYLKITDPDVIRHYTEEYIKFVGETGGRTRALEHSYIRGRQRYHFGHRIRCGLYFGNLSFNPLFTTSAMRGFGAQNYREMRSHRLLNEVTYCLSPLLHSIEYEDESSRRGISGFGERPINMPSVFAEERTRLKPIFDFSPIRENQRLFWDQRNATGQRALEELLDWGALREIIDADKLLSRVAWRQSNNDSFYKYWINKFIAINRSRTFV